MRRAFRAVRFTRSTRCSPIRRSSTWASCNQIDTGDARGTLSVVGQPVSLARTPSKLVAAPPECGQHTQEVLREFGFSDDEIADLRNAKVI